MRRHIALTIGTLLMTACPAPFTDLCDNGACDADASLNDTGVDAPPGCDLTKDPKDSLPCVDDGVGIFVDATNGKDTNAGTKAAPMQTIGAALGKTNTQHARVYICEGTYAEDVTLDASHDGVSLYGGWKCGDWSYSGGKPTIGKSSLAAKIDSLVKGTTVADLTISAADGINAGDSSISMLVSASQNINIVRVVFAAGTGVKGADGALTVFNFPASLDGNPAIADDGGAPKVVNCPAGDVSTGGKGGDVTANRNGDDGLPNLGAGDGGAGGTNSCSNGTAGNIGHAGDAGAGSSSRGSITTKWGASSGTTGASGGVGQGGGGGGANFVSGPQHGGGGSGGSGGCGGAGGGGGQGGGSSFGLVTVASSVNVTLSSVTTHGAGAGGNGAGGQVGQSVGGLGGAGTIPGCNGGGGGVGGNGGGGGGGAGGLSVGVFYKGAVPNVDASTTSAITIGAKGSGGIGASANNGVDGDAQTILECKLPLCN